MENEFFMYVSGWAGRGGTPGLALFGLDKKKGAIRPIRMIRNDVSFGNFYLDRDRKLLYVCNEDDLSDELGYNSGRVYGYKIDPETGDLEERFHCETLCANPTGVCMDLSGRFMAVSNHSTPGGITTEIVRDDSGYRPLVHCNEAVVELFSLDAEGCPEKLIDVKKHGEPIPAGKNGQKNINHVNSVTRAPKADVFAACDKGDGCVYMYRLENESLRLTEKRTTIGAGGHPRACVFHPEQPFLFVNHEHSFDGRMDVCSFRYTEDGSLTEICAVNTLPSDYSLRERSMEQQGFCIHPAGIALYTVQRGNNAVCVLSIDPFSGELRVLQNVDIPGSWPRGCAITPDGSHLAVACRDSGEIFVYAVEPDGLLMGPISSAAMKGCASIAFYEA